MARVFTTEFLFNLRHYKAIVVMHDGSNGLHIRVRFFDAYDLLENDSIEFVGLKGYKNLENLQPETKAFLEELSNAIVKHLSNN